MLLQKEAPIKSTPTPIKIQTKLDFAGSGLKHRHRVIIGRGLHSTSKQNKDMFLDLPNTNLYLERTKLKNRNILSVKYKSNRNNHPKLKPLRVSKNLLSVIEDILDEHFDDRIIKLLSPDELIVLENFINISKYPIVLDKEELKNFQKNFDILLGEAQSGNDNPEIIKNLKLYIWRAIKRNLMNKEEGIEILLTL